MKKIIFYIFFINLVISNQSTAEIKYKTYNKLPCKFNGAKVTSTASPNSWAPSPKKGVCTKGKGYAGKMGTTIEKKRGTPVIAVKDMELIIATDYSSEFSCVTDNLSQLRKIKGTRFKTLKHPQTGKKMKCRYPFDGLSLTFKTWDGDIVLYYHLMPDTPLVPGFGKGKCKIRKFYQLFYTEQRTNIIVDHNDCGGIKKKNIKKGELIGYVGHATNDHISFNISPKQKGFLNSPESKKHNLLWETYPKNPNAFLLPIMSKKYLREKGIIN